MADEDDRIDVTDENDLDFEDFTKRPVIIQAAQIDEPFKVDTLEGDDQHGKPGDYLVVGVEGERYPVDQDIFEETYRPLEPDAVETPGERREWVQFDWSGDVSRRFSEELVAALRERGDFNEDEDVHVQRVHVEVESDPRINGAEVIVIDRDGEE
jgi:hypothetical protein